MSRFATAALMVSLLGVEAIDLAPRDDAPPRVIRQPLYRHHIPDPVQRDRRRFLHQQRRQTDGKTLDVPIRNDVFLYYMNMSIGTPPQDFEVGTIEGMKDAYQLEALCLLETPSSQTDGYPTQ